MTLIFKRDVLLSMKGGKLHKAGSIVPDGYSTPAGLAEMLAHGDIEERNPAPIAEVIVDEVEPEVEEEIEPEIAKAKIKKVTKK